MFGQDSQAAEQPLDLAPLSFFHFSADCHYLGKDVNQLPMGVEKLSAFFLPNTAFLSGEQLFAQMAMGWSEAGLAFFVEVQKGGDVRCSFPQITNGDSVEIFIDTRDIKSSGYNTRFCHHFFFLPEAIEGHSCGELTHFRTEDSHPLCDAQGLQCTTVYTQGGYGMHMHIPAEALFGFDPGQFQRCGFTYRINRAGGAPQHFSTSSADFDITQQPALWASLHLIRDRFAPGVKR